MNRQFIDAQRIARFFSTPDGQNFIDRQIGLQLMNPKINAPYSEGIFDSSPANQRTYNFGLNTEFQIAMGGFAKGHIKREGSIPFNERGYIKDKTILSNSTENNRLIYLFSNKISDFDYAPPPTGFAATGLGSFISNAASTINNVLNKLGGKGESLYDYIGGPGSTMGLGRTHIGRYTNTVLIGGKVKNYHSYFDYSSRISRQVARLDGDSYPYARNYIELVGGKRGLGEDERWKKYNLGNPGKEPSSNKVNYGKPYRYDLYIERKMDRLNSFDVVRQRFGGLPHQSYYELGNYERWAPKDFIPFYFEALDFRTNRVDSDMLYFRAFMDSISDNFKASHNKFNYNGRAESFFTYKSFDRSLSFNFKIAAQTRNEMMPLYRKLNYLASNTAPEYHKSSGRIKTPFMRITIGDWIARLPGVLTSVGIKWGKDYPWEIRQDPEGQDLDMLILPHILDVDIGFQPIHTFRPEKGINKPFILPNHLSQINLDDLQKWLSLGIAGYSTKEHFMAEEMRDAVLNPNSGIKQEDLYTQTDYAAAKVASRNGKERLEEAIYHTLADQASINNAAESIELIEPANPNNAVDFMGTIPGSDGPVEIRSSIIDEGTSGFLEGNWDDGLNGGQGGFLQDINNPNSGLPGGATGPFGF